MDDHKMTSTKSPGRCRQMVRFPYTHHRGCWEQYWHQAHIPISFIPRWITWILKIGNIYNSVGVPVRGLGGLGACLLRGIRMTCRHAFLLGLIEVGRPMLHWGGAIPWAEPWTERGESDLGISICAFFTLIPDDRCNVTSSRRLLLLWHPCSDGLWLLLP